MSGGSDDVLTVPLMRTLNRGVAVQRPDGYIVPVQLGPVGAVSVGPGQLPGIGGVLHIALHHPDGETLVLTMNGLMFNQFARLINDAGERLANGQAGLGGVGHA